MEETHKIMDVLDDGHVAIATMDSNPWAWVNFVGYSTTYQSYYDSGVRFAGIQISRGQKITSAMLRVCISNFPTPPTTINFAIYGDARDNPPNFASTNLPLIPNRPRTLNGLVLTGFKGETGVWVEFDVTEIVQELINRDGWIQGNAIALLFIHDPESTGFFSFRAIDEGSGFEAILVINWTPATGTGALEIHALSDSTEVVADATVDDITGYKTTGDAGAPLVIANLTAGEHIVAGYYDNLKDEKTATVYLEQVTRVNLVFTTKAPPIPLWKIAAIPLAIVGGGSAGYLILKRRKVKK